MMRISVGLALVVGVAVLDAQGDARANAVTVVVGCVVDTALKSPLEGATVWMKGGRDTALTDSIGFFRVTTERQVAVDTLLVRRIGYESDARVVRMDGRRTVVLGAVPMRWGRYVDGIPIDSIRDTVARREVIEEHRRYEANKVNWPSLMKRCVDSLAKVRS